MAVTYVGELCSELSLVHAFPFVDSDFLLCVRVSARPCWHSSITRTRNHFIPPSEGSERKTLGSCGKACVLLLVPLARRLVRWSGGPGPIWSWGCGIFKPRGPGKQGDVWHGPCGPAYAYRSQCPEGLTRRRQLSWKGTRSGGGGRDRDGEGRGEQGSIAGRAGRGARD